MTQREIPNISFSEVPTGYAKILAHGYDSVQETYPATISQATWVALEKAQEKAREEDDGEGVPFDLGGRTFMVSPVGARGGVRFVLRSDDYLIMLRSQKVDYCLTIRYSASGLWSQGYVGCLMDAKVVLQEQQVDWSSGRLGRADWCFDFHCVSFSDEFTPSMANGVIAPSACKVKQIVKVVTHSRGGMGETLTVGTKSGLQVEVYDKNKEIVEASGKEWMRDIWADAANGEVLENHVWRLEIRMGKEFLRDRKILTYYDLEKNREALLSEALVSRRLTVPSKTDSNRRRWPMHPLWTMAFRNVAVAHMLPRGRVFTARREELAYKISKQISGSLRALSVLKFGKADREILTLFSDRAAYDAIGDDNHQEKIDRLIERYSDVDQPR